MPTRRPCCYVASPLGFTEAGRAYYRDVFIPALAHVVEPLDPWALAAPTAASGGGDNDARDRLLAAGRRNTAAIRRSAVVVAVLDGQELDSGTVAELGYAAGLGKRCFGLRSDLRQAGEPGVSVNLQVETFVVDSGGTIVTSLAELIAVLRTTAENRAR
jgi:nucleoside 2-deoxyribosyltransferase